MTWSIGHNFAAAPGAIFVKDGYGSLLDADIGPSIPKMFQWKMPSGGRRDSIDVLTIVR